MNDSNAELNFDSMTLSDVDLDAYVRGDAELCDLLGLPPDLMERLRGRAQFFLDGGHDERALIMLEMLEELDRADRRASLLAVETLLRLGLSDRAEEKVADLLVRAPDDPEVWVAKARLELSTGRWFEAATTLERVVARDPDAQAPVTQRALHLAQDAHARFESSR